MSEPLLTVPCNRCREGDVVLAKSNDGFVCFTSVEAMKEDSQTHPEQYPDTIEYQWGFFRKYAGRNFIDFDNFSVEIVDGVMQVVK